MQEFPTWSSVATSHIASHVKLRSIRCIECRLDFTSKESLMSHLHCHHSALPEGVRIDVSIANHDRRRLQCKSDLSPSSDTLLSSGVLSTDSQQDSSAEKKHVESITSNENFADKNKARVTEADSVINDTDGCDVDVETNSESSREHADNSPVFQTDNTVRSSADISSPKTCKRKSHKPSHVVLADAGCPEITCVTDPDWVEIIPATHPMKARCPHCTFTCNTDLQLKV